MSAKDHFRNASLVLTISDDGETCVISLINRDRKLEAEIAFDFKATELLWLMIFEKLLQNGP